MTEMPENEHDEFPLEGSEEFLPDLIDNIPEE